MTGNSPALASQLHAPARPNRALTAGNYVIAGPTVGGRRLASRLRDNGIRALSSQGPVEPSDTTKQSRAIIVWANSVEDGLRQCHDIRGWAHESLLPILVVTSLSEVANDRSIWRAAFSCFVLGDDDARLFAMAQALDLGRRGLPTIEDADLTWTIRSFLRTPALASRGVGLDAFVAGRVAFIGGLLHETASVNALAQRLLVPATTQVNFDGIRCMPTTTTLPS